MNTQHSHEPVQITPDPDRLHLYHRQQLSAMLDGELAPDEARFMLRRLQHDVELASCWERWQVCGDVLRGRADDLLPADFAQRVARAIQCPEPAAAVTAARSGSRPRGLWQWSGGAALAASLALVAWGVLREPPVSLDSAPVAGAAVAADAVPAAASAPLLTAAAPTADSDDTPARIAVAVADTPAPASMHSAAVRAAPSALAVAAAGTAPAVAGMPPAGDLLAPARQAPLVPRPWPRSLLPDPGIGALRAVVGYGIANGRQAGQAVLPAASADAFQPRWPDAPPSDWRTPPASALLATDAADPAGDSRP